MTVNEMPPVGSEYPFPSRYAEINGSRLHYIEEGAGTPIIMLHGNPTWSYMYRNIIPHLSPNARCLAVDLIGMGLSGKPDIGYTFREHVDYMGKWVDQLELRDFIVVGHDWGATIGLQLASERPDRVRAVAMLEPQALVPKPSWAQFSPPESEGLFRTLRDPEAGWPFMRDNNVFVEGMPRIIVNRSFTREEHERYREPFRNPADRKPMWVFPNQIPIGNEPAEVAQAVEERNRWFTATDIPKLLLYATPGCSVREPELAWCRSQLGQLTLEHVGRGFHHLTEENPQAVGEALLRWLVAMERPA
ncbi:MAG: haloalkane dehalogenase [Paenibacillaceae bacterium]|nr:haloalkane dehalogenase [Paenibacillaceae bacterium]